MTTQPTTHGRAENRSAGYRDGGNRHRGEHAAACCGARFGGLNTAHCSGCHQTFTGLTAFDKNRDGNITKKEAASNKDLTKQWDTLDANKDGKLDQGEFAQFEASGSAGGASGSTSDSMGSSTRSGASSSKSPSSDKERPKY